MTERQESGKSLRDELISHWDENCNGVDWLAGTPEEYASEAIRFLAAHPVEPARPLLDRGAAIKVLGGSELAAATVDHLLSAEVVRPMPTQAELADWLRETFTADTIGPTWDLAAECLLIALNGEA